MQARLPLQLVALLVLLSCGTTSGSSGITPALEPAPRQDRLQKEANHLYICSFNVYKLGSIEAKYDALEEDDDDDVAPGVPERIKTLAKVLTVGAFDLIVLQEVTDGERGNWALTDLVAELKASHSLTYEFFLSPFIGMGLMREAMAFIYNPAVVKPQIISGTTSMVSLIEIPGRDLVRTQWLSGEFDFTLVSAHLAWGNESDRKAGDKKIHEILTTPAPSAFSDDPDIIVLGDMNRFGLNFTFFDGVTYSDTQFLAPNICIFDPAFRTVKEVKASHIAGKGIPGDNPQLLSTTVAKNTFVYDMILFTPDADEEFPGTKNACVFGTDFGVICYDEKDAFGYQAGADTLGQNALKEAYSDHRPLWMRFKTNAGQRDTVGTGPAQPAAASKFLATASGKKFHKPGCSTIQGKATPKEWTSREEASLTHGPCGVCKP